MQCCESGMIYSGSGSSYHFLRVSNPKLFLPKAKGAKNKICDDTVENVFLDENELINIPGASQNILVKHISRFLYSSPVKY